MPRFDFQNPLTGEIKEVILSINDPKEYQENGIKFNRLFSVPNMGIDTLLDPHSSSDFIKATANKRGSMGDLYDRSAEMSERRKEKNGGLDPVKEKYYEDYSKDRKGLKHPEVKQRETKERLKNLGVNLEN